MFDDDGPFSFMNHPYALPGDVIFCGQSGKGLHIREFQRLRSVPNADYVHVAIVVATGEIMEAMWRKKAYALPAAEWRKGRRDADSLTILRSPASNREDLIERMMNAGIFWLEQGYALGQALANEASPLEESTCAVLAQRVLAHAGLLAETAVPAAGHLYPGALFDLLKAHGWREIPADDRYFEPPLGSEVSGIGTLRRFLSEGRQFERIMDEFGETAGAVNRSVRGLDFGGALSFLLSVQSTDGMQPFAYLQAVAHSTFSYFHSLHQAATSPPGTWEAQAERDAVIRQRKARADEELEQLLFVVGQLRSFDAEFFSTAAVLSAIDDIRAFFEERRPLPPKATETLVRSYFHDRTRFIAGYGLAPEEYSPDALAIDWSGLESLSNFQTEAVADFRKRIEGVIEPLGAIIGTRKDALLSRRPFLVHFLGEEKPAEIDRNIADKVRRAVAALRAPARP